MPQEEGATPLLWAQFRFSVIGSLLSSPAAAGELKAALEALSQRVFKHPVTGEPVQYAVPTLERWYYRARNAKRDPVTALRRQPRRDAGFQVSLPEPLRAELLRLYKAHSHWTAKLLYDNLRARSREEPSLGKVPSYASVRRFLRANGLYRQRRLKNADRPGLQAAQERWQTREVRSYECEHANSLWHLDFHFGSLKVLTPQGAWVRPIILAVLDDYSRLICHAQWYLSETAEDLVHGVSQAIQKRGLPRALLTDNGAAMLAEEVKLGLLRLGILHETTLPYSPYQNGKQESFWGVVEGRLLPMLEDVEDLKLELLNESTQAWVELEYNRAVHSETSERPLDRFLRGPDVSRPAPPSDDLRNAFRQDVKRTQRRSDGTVSLSGVRLEIPGRYRHLKEVVVRYARWNLQNVHLVDARSDTLLCALYPQDKTQNADGRRRVLEPTILSSIAPGEPEGNGVAPLLRQILEDYASTGLPPAYLPKPSEPEEPQP